MIKLYILILLVSICVAIQANEVEIEVLTETTSTPLADDPLISKAIILVENVLNEAELKYTIKVQPWARIYQVALQKNNVLIFPLVRNQQREQLFHWIAPLQRTNYVLFGLSDLKIDPEAPLPILNNFRLSIIRQTAPHQYLKSKGFNNFHLVSRNEQSIRMLLAGRVDLIAGESVGFFNSCIQLKLDCSNIKPLYKLKEPSTAYYFALSKSTDMQVVKQIKTAYDKIIKK